MKFTKKQLKRIIREEYNLILKESGWEMDDEMMDIREELLDLASREEGISLGGFWLLKQKRKVIHLNTAGMSDKGCFDRNTKH